MVNHKIVTLIGEVNYVLDYYKQWNLSNGDPDAKLVMGIS